MNLIPTDIWAELGVQPLFKLTKHIQFSINSIHILDGNVRLLTDSGSELYKLGYNITSQGRFQGPFPSNFILAGNRRMEIDYDNFQVELEFRDLEATSFEVRT